MWVTEILGRYNRPVMETFHYQNVILVGLSRKHDPVLADLVQGGGDRNGFAGEGGRQVVDLDSDAH